MINSGITTKTPGNIKFGAGVFFQNVTYSETVAPTEEAIIAGLLGATQDGGTVTITPEFFEPDLDGKLVAVEELTEKVGEEAIMETSMAELTPALIAKSVIGTISETTDGNYDVITSSKLGKGHFYSGFGYYGKHLDGRPLIILFKKALCTSGFSSENKNKTNSVFKGTYKCYSDLEYGVEKLPYAIFVRKKEGWVPVEPEEVTTTE